MTPMRVVICGGGTAGWMSASALARIIMPAGVTVTLIESDDIGTIGVGEATIPPILNFNGKLGIDEATFLKATGGTYKLGIEFVNWGAVGERYMHPFGSHGIDWQDIRFHQFWLKARQIGDPSRWGAFETYSINACAARLNRFTHPTANPESILSSFKYAFHIDASLYARFLRTYSETRGVKRAEGKIVHVRQTDAGDIAAVRLESGVEIEGDLFVDCTGFRALLIEGALKVSFENWNHWLPNNSALAVPTRRADPITPYTRATAESAGWRWRIPLQHRTGNGHVYASDFMSDDRAADLLMLGLDSELMDTPRPIRFRTGRRKIFWERNCVAIGLSAGFLEPLESTSIHLIQMGIAKLLALFPGNASPDAQRATYNAMTASEYEQARDFIVLHYKATRREDSEYWRYLRNMPIPDSLQRKLDLFNARGTVVRRQDELFTEDSWLAVLFGQGVIPTNYDPVADCIPLGEIEALISRIRQIVQKGAEMMPSYADHQSLRGRAK